jgi:predicted acylesterase/phospholipase RssA
MKKCSFAVLFSILLFTGCVSKPVQHGAPGAPTAAVQPDGTPAPETPATPANHNRITLVVGGAGVASFATVGLLKKFYEEGVEVELIVATGWPTLFALANGFLKSIHDLEWFATRLERKDFDKMGSVDFRQDIDPSQGLPPIVLNSFPQTLLNQTRVPVVIAATNTDLGEPDVFGSGEWKEPLLRTASVPGLYRKFSAERGTGWIDAVSALDVREAVRRGATTIVAVSMYEDYLNSVGSKKDDELIRRVYAAQMRKSVSEALKQAGAFSGKIVLGKEPTDYAAKRAAIAAGYREGARLIKKLREPAAATAN